jgi:hypothetical protein
MMHPHAMRSLALAMLVLAAQPVRADDECYAQADKWQPRSAVQALAARNGWQIDKLKIDDGCYEIRGRDANDRRFKAKLDPATLKVLRMKREHDDRTRTDDKSTKPGDHQ